MATMSSTGCGGVFEPINATDRMLRKRLVDHDALKSRLVARAHHGTQVRREAA